MNGAMIYKDTANQNIAHNVHAFVTFNRIVYDTAGFFDILCPTRIIVPSGASKVIMKAQIIFAGNPHGMRQLVIKKNFSPGGGWYPGVPAQTMVANERTTTDVQVFTCPIPVVAGDFFELEAFQTSGGNLDILASVGSWFSIEVVE